MNLVADEGVDRAIVDALRASGFSVKYFAECGAGATGIDHPERRRVRELIANIQG